MDLFASALGAASPYDHILPPQSVPDVDRLLSDLAQMDGLSDVWLTEGQPPRFKRQGAFVSLSNLGPLSPDLMHDWLKHVLHGEPWKYSQDAAHKVDTPAGPLRFRVNAFSTRNVTRVCLRLVNTLVPHHRALMLPETVVKGMVTTKDGIAFFVGPTGSGKSTSIASTLTERASLREGHIITIEDPIEYEFQDAASFFTQRQLGQDFMSFPDALRAALRQAPDDILIGEIRDRDTAEIALHAAETGHFVMSTLHTGRAPKAIERFKLLFPEEKYAEINAMLANHLRFVLCQRLLRGIDGRRLGLYEVMSVKNDSGIRPLIRSDKVANIYSAMESGGDAENMTFEKHLEDVYARKLITKQVYDQTCEELRMER